MQKDDGDVTDVALASQALDKTGRTATLARYIDGLVEQPCFYGHVCKNTA